MILLICILINWEQVWFHLLTVISFVSPELLPPHSDYKVMDATVWCRRVIECFEQYLRELSDGLQALPRKYILQKQLNK